MHVYKNVIINFTFNQGNYFWCHIFLSRKFGSYTTDGLRRSTISSNTAHWFVIKLVGPFN